MAESGSKVMAIDTDDAGQFIGQSNDDFVGVFAFKTGKPAA